MKISLKTRYPCLMKVIEALQGKIMASNRKYNLLTKLLGLEGDSS